MCGIAGAAVRRGSASPVAAVERATEAMLHRGPDAGAVHAIGNVVLGHRRLGIIAPGEAADQPFRSADGRYTIAFNGEIYNYRALRAKLPEYAFRTASDTEVLLAAYMAWGPACLEQLEGMFAFAVVDQVTGELFLARDRFGVKPIYLYIRDGELYFASELRALLASGMLPRRMDPAALVDYLRYQTVQAPASLIAGVHMLPAGGWLRWNNGQQEEGRYWVATERADPQAVGHDRTTVLRNVRERLQLAVEKRLVSDVPFGAFLSGGIDSSAVVGLMAAASTAPVHTFSVVFNEERYSEERYARMVAEKFRTEHSVIRLTPDDMLHALPDALAAMDHPSADGPNTWVVSKYTKAAGVTMALTGLGGDEVFGGYAVFTRSLAMQRKAWLGALPAPVRGVLAAALRVRRRTAATDKAAALLAAGDMAWPRSYPWSRLTVTDNDLHELIALPRLPANAVRSLVDAQHAAGASALPLLSQVSLAELGSYLQNVLLRDADQMSMAHALELRVPFLDHHLVEYVLGVPDAIKYPHTPKQLLVDALGDLLPHEVVHRPKMGFVLPWEEWLKGELRGFAAERLQRLGQRDPFRAAGVDERWKRFLAGDKRVNWSRIWQLVVLADWLERNAVE